MNDTEKHFLSQHLELLQKSLNEVESELVYIDWLKAQKQEEAAEIKKNYNDLGNALVEAGVMEQT